MSGRPRRVRDEEDEGLGLAGGLLLAGGAAAVGFLAYKLFTKDKPTATNTVGNDFADCFSNEPTPKATSDLWGSKSSTSDLWGSKSSTSDVLGLRSSLPAKVPEVKKCINCYENPREVLLGPCNHALCEDCAEEIKTDCPICHRPIVSKKPTYL